MSDISKPLLDLAQIVLAIGGMVTMLKVVRTNFQWKWIKAMIVLTGLMVVTQNLEGNLVWTIIWTVLLVWLVIMGIASKTSST